MGGKLGVILTEEMRLINMSDLAKVPKVDLVRRFGEKTGLFFKFKHKLICILIKDNYKLIIN